MDIGYEQVLGWVAALLVVSSFQCGSRRSIILMQVFSCLAFSVHFALLGAWAGAALNLLGVLRLVTALSFERYPLTRQLYLLFFPLIWAITGWVAESWTDMLPAIGYTLGTLAVMQRDLLHMRLLYLLAHPFWLAYNLLVGSQGGTAVEILNIVSSSLAIRRQHAERHAGEGHKRFPRWPFRRLRKLC